jgi:molybdopterin/thiamine biosynthesis adenylyltransferase
MTGSPPPAAPFPVVRDRDRVRRLVALPGVRPAMVERLARATVAVVGVGGLGSGAAPYLAAAGVGRLRLVDPGTVAATDLGRQILYRPSDIGRPKVAVMAERLTAQNPAIIVEGHETALGDDNIHGLLAGVDVVVDGLDQGAPRDLLNRWAVATGIPVVFGGALGYEGQVMVVQGKAHACLACLFGSVADAAADCAVNGVLGPLVGVIGAIQATEAVKGILGTGSPLVGRLLQWDAFTGEIRTLRVPKRPGCLVCGAGGEPGRTAGSTTR